MVSRGCVLTLHALVWAAALALALRAASAADVGASPHDTATPHTPPYTKYKYIPLSSSFDRYDPGSPEPASTLAATSGGMAPSELILTALRTALDVVRNINQQRARARAPPVRNTTALIHRRTRTKNGTTAESGRGFEDYYDEHHEHPETTTTAKPMKQGRYTDPWAGYYDWIINEGSFKFWSVFQLFTAALLLYACFSAIYYAKFNPILPDYDREYDDYFLERTVGRQTRSKGAGSLIGGYLMKFFGTRPTYQIFAGATFITGCMYFLFNKFYIGKRAMGDENDICKKKSAIADVEGRDTNNTEADKGKLTLDGASKTEIIKPEHVAIDKLNVLEVNQKAKLVSDNTDGGSDSGVENPAYTETETNNAMKNDIKTNG